MRRFGLAIGLGLALLAGPAAAQEAFAVRFEHDQDSLSARAAAQLRTVAERFRVQPEAQVVISGHTDRRGDAAENVGLAQRRANAVRQFLATVGVPAMSMTTQAFGESRNAVDTADDVAEPANNRVEIVFGPGSGW